MREKAVAAILVAAFAAGCSTQTGSTGSVQNSSGSALPNGSPGSSSSNSSSSGNVVVPLGTSIHITGPNNLSADVTVFKVDYFQQGQGGAAAPSANGQFAVGDVGIKVTSGRYDFNPFYFLYQAQGGTTYDMTAGNAVPAAFDPTLQAGTLGPGQDTRGLVTFDVPKGQGRDIQVTDPFGAVVGQWKLS